MDIAVENIAGGVTEIVLRGRFDTTRMISPQVPPPTVVTSPEEAKIGDLDTHLVRGFASGIACGRRDGRNRLSLRFVEPQATSH
jgi:hypothetical protein